MKRHNLKTLLNKIFSKDTYTSWYFNITNHRVTGGRDESNNFHTTSSRTFRLLLASKLGLILMLMLAVVPFTAFEAHVANVIATIEPPPCQACEGGIISMALEYQGDSGAQIRVEQNKGQDTIVFDEWVEPGETFSFIGTWNMGRLGTEITIFINGSSQTKIHTSCSQAVGPGLIFGDFEVKAAESKAGGAICPLPPEEIPTCEECAGGVTNFTLKYLGIVSAFVEVIQKKDIAAFSGNVDPGESFSFVGTGKDGKLGPEIVILIDGVENTVIHTSCSIAVSPGLVFGDFEIEEATSRVGGSICPLGETAISTDSGGFSFSLSPTVTIVEGLITPDSEAGTSSDEVAEETQEEPIEEDLFTFATSTDSVEVTETASTTTDIIADDTASTTESTIEEQNASTTTSETEPPPEVLSEEFIEEPVGSPAEETPTEGEPAVESEPPIEDPVVEEEPPPAEEPPPPPPVEEPPPPVEDPT